MVEESRLTEGLDGEAASRCAGWFSGSKVKTGFRSSY